MASRYATHVSPTDMGEFVIDRKSENEIDIYYDMSPARLASLQLDPEISTTFRLMTMRKAEDWLTMYPTNTIPGRENFLSQKYELVESITLEGFGIETPRTKNDIYDFLNTLPSGFVKDPEYGLGLQHDFRFIVEAIEANPDLRHLVLTKRGKSAINGDTHYIRASDFDAIRRGLNRAHRGALARAMIDKRILAHNALMTAVDCVAYPEQQRPYRKDAIFKIVSGRGNGAPELSEADGMSVVNLVSRNKHKLAETHPKELLRLQRDIELVTLESLIAKIEEKMAKNVAEADWQTFFSENPFILSLAFGLPMLVIGEKIAVGGMTIDSKGEKYADFLQKNNFTDNLTLVEIKTSKSKLLGREYRGGVFPPAAELSGAVSQVLDQRYQLQKGLVAAKDSSHRYDLESYAVKCIVVIGVIPVDADEKKSLELYRSALNDVLVVTFDELLGKLKHLYTFLQGAPGTDASLR